jgi:predicted kinase
MTTTALRAAASVRTLLVVVRAPKPTLVVVSGPPGSGKTTLAHALGRAIPCPAVCRDEIKEGMAHAQGAGFQGGSGDPLTQRTLPLFFDLLRLLVEAGVSVVAEAAFQDRLWRPGLEPLADRAEIRIVRCRVDSAVSFERASTRGSGSRSRLRVHGDSAIDGGIVAWTEAFEAFEHVSIPAPSIDVDTSDGYAPELEAIVDFLNQA